MEAKPPVITANNSDCVIRAINGFTTSGASVCPTNTLAAADKLSVREVPSAFCNAPPSTFTTKPITPK